MEPEEQLVILRLHSPRIYRNPSPHLPVSRTSRLATSGVFGGAASTSALELDLVSLTSLCHLWGHLRASGEQRGPRWTEPATSHWTEADRGLAVWTEGTGSAFPLRPWPRRPPLGLCRFSPSARLFRETGSQ